MRTYTFELVVNEGGDEFWEGLQQDGSHRGYATCEEVEELVRDLLSADYPLEYKLTLRKFENAD